MDCKTARLLLEVAPPRKAELDEAEAGALHAHLVECVVCRGLADEERRIDEHLGAALRSVAVPAGLRERLHRSLEAEEAARRSTQRRRLVSWTAAAAAVVLSGVLWWLMRPLPVPNLEQVHAESLPRSAAEAEQRWAEMGVPTAAPPLFNYQWLAACQLVEFQGHSRVPHLLFLRDRERAEVYVLSSKRFDVQALTAQGRLDSGGYTVEVHAHPFDERIVFLVKYTGGSLERFLLPEGTPTT